MLFLVHNDENDICNAHAYMTRVKYEIPFPIFQSNHMETTKINAHTHTVEKARQEDASALDINATNCAAASLVELLFNIRSSRVSTVKYTTAADLHECCTVAEL